MNYETKSTAWLKDRLAKLDKICTTSLLEASKILHELQRRKAFVPQTKSGFFKHYREIASGKLLPEIVLNIASPTAIPYIMRLGRQEQVALLKGGKVTIAEHDARGQIISVDRHPNRLTLGQWEMAIGDEGYRPFNDQKRILAKRGNDVRRTKVIAEVKADMATDEIVLGQIRVPARKVMAALIKLGYHVEAPEPRRPAKQASGALHAN